MRRDRQDGDLAVVGWRIGEDGPVIRHPTQEHRHPTDYFKVQCWDRERDWHDLDDLKYSTYKEAVEAGEAEAARTDRTCYHSPIPEEAPTLRPEESGSSETDGEGKAIDVVKLQAERKFGTPDELSQEVVKAFNEGYLKMADAITSYTLGWSSRLDTSRLSAAQ
jgi:hypothetical protein